MPIGSSLFNLISRAGSMTLSELNARTSSDFYGLGHELASMLQKGTVVLSAEGEMNFGKWSIKDLNSGRLSAESPGDVADALTAALSDEVVARNVTVFPTTQGYRSAIS